MVVAVKCKSLLLKQTLSIFLKDYIGTSDKCDILISDGFMESKNRVFIVSDRDDANITIPFSKEELLQSLSLFYKEHTHIDLRAKEKNTNQIQHNSLEEDIESLMKDYTRKILDTIKKHKNNT